MSNPLLYEQNLFVVLEPNLPEQFLEPIELLVKLKEILATRQDGLPRDLQKFTDIEAQAQYLMETSCELSLDPGQYLQWYAVRLEK
jgi:Protein CHLORORESPIRATORY REDUCTION 7